MAFDKVAAALLVIAIVTQVACSQQNDGPTMDRPTSDHVMLILRGVANSENPRGQLDDDSALEYARRVGFQGEVLDVAGNTSGDNAQTRLALERIRRENRIAAIYAFLGGGYNARVIWQQLDPAERERIRKVVVIGSPGIDKADFADATEVLIAPDPPEGHMAGPKALLESLGSKASKSHL